MSEIELKPLLKTLISAPGLSGFEAPIRKIISEYWSPLVDEIATTALGSLHGTKRGTQSSPRHKILLAAHMDAIGLMVTAVEDGFIRATQVGGIDPRILPGQQVLVHGKQDLPAIVVQPADALLPPDQRDKPVPLNSLLIDTGLEADQVKSWVKVGDPISFANLPIELSDDLISGHSQDNRASIAALTICLQELAHMRHTWDVVAAATTQEEETLGGGFTSSFQEKPTIAIAVDVIFASSPGVSDYNTYPLGKGVTLSLGPNIHPAIYRFMKDLCKQLDIPYHDDVIPRHSGTDAYAMQISAEGIPTMVLGIPLRYMHTPVEVVNIKDIQRAGHLLAEFIARLDADFIQKLTWDL
jgi:tetrahedral aminopeptidase